MPRDELDSNLKDWVKRRTEAVHAKYSAFDALIELNVEGLADEDTSVSVFCPFHSNTKTTAARYYPSTGRQPGGLYCFVCRESWKAVNIFAKAKGLRFMDALVTLERRFHINIPKRPDGPAIVEPVDRSSSYVSADRNDIPRMLTIMETKLLRIRDKVCMVDYVKFCRVIDAISYDFDKIGKATPGMVNMLNSMDEKMSEAVSLASFVPEVENDTGAHSSF